MIQLHLEKVRSVNRDIELRANVVYYHIHQQLVSGERQDLQDMKAAMIALDVK